MKFKIFLLTALFVLVGTAAEIDFRTLPERAFWVTRGSTIQLTGVPPVIKLTWDPAQRKFAEWSFARQPKINQFQKLTVTVKYKVNKGSLHTATIRLRDWQGEIFQFQQNLKPGMDKMTFTVDMKKFRSNGSWPENKKAVADKKLSFPVALLGMSIHYPANSVPGEMIIESVCIETEPAQNAPKEATVKKTPQGAFLRLENTSWKQNNGDWVGTLPADTPAFPRLKGGCFSVEGVAPQTVKLVFSCRNTIVTLTPEKDGTFPVPFAMDDAPAVLKKVIVRSSAASAPSVRGIIREALPLALKFKMGKGSAVHVWQKGSAGDLLFVNNTNSKVSGKGLLQFRSYPDGKILEEKELLFDLPPKGDLNVSLTFPDRYGLYTVSGFLPGNKIGKIPFSRRVACLAPLAPAKHEGMQYGMMVMTWPLPVMERAAAATALSGADFVRSSIIWNDVERQRGKWNWKYTDGYMDILTKNGLRWAPMLWYPPAWATAKDWKPSYTPVRKRLGFPRPDYAAWEEYVRQSVRRYGDRIKVTEIWNEPELPGFANFSPEEYAELLKRATAVARKEKPAVKVSTCGYTCLPGQHPRMTYPDFMPRSLKAADGYYDITSIHGHGFFPDFCDMIDGFIKLRKRLNVTVPWAANETAVSSSWCSRQVQAEVLFQKMIFVHARGGGAYVWHNLRDLGRNPLNKEHNFGLFDANFEPKEAFAAYHTVVNLFRGAVFRKDLSANGGYCFLFENQGKFLAAGWTFQPPAAEKLLRFKNVTGNVFSVDLCGNRTPVKAVDGEVLFKLTATPSTLVFEQNQAPVCAGEFLTSGKTGEFRIAVPRAVQAVQARFGKGGFLERQLHNGIFAIAELKQRLQKVTPVSIRLKTVWGDVELKYYAISRLSFPAGDDFSRKPDFEQQNSESYCSTSPNDPMYADCYFKGAEDCSVKTWLGLKNDKVILQLQVRDDIHFQDKKGTQLYIGDSLQVLFSRTATGGRWKFGFALGNDGKVGSFCWNKPDKRSGEAVLAKVKCSIVRREKSKETFYRIEFPAGELGIAPGVPFRFNIQLNDNDGKCRVGYHAIAEVLDDGKNDTGFPEITFQK